MSPLEKSQKGNPARRSLASVRISAKSAASIAANVLTQKSLAQSKLTYSAVREGVPASLVKDMNSEGLTREDIRQIIPDRTLERRIAAGESLKIDEADGLARLLRIVTMARQVFEDTALANEWLRSPNPALDGLIPIQMARTDLGGREVEAVLTRLAHGVF